jgi:hypothetical protein
MLHRKLSDTDYWQAVGLIKAGIQHRRVGEKNEGIQGGSNPSL